MYEIVIMELKKFEICILNFLLRFKTNEIANTQSALKSNIIFV